MVHDKFDDEAIHGLVESAHAQVCEDMRTLLGLIAELDRTEAWRSYGHRCAIDDLVASLDIFGVTAKKWVQWAHALDKYPKLATSFAAGAVSVDGLDGMIKIMAAKDPDVIKPA